MKRAGTTNGGDPTSPHPLFDASYYLANNPQVRQNQIDPLVHYLQHGAREGRDPHPLFDSTFYMQQLPEPTTAGINPLIHYLQDGAGKGFDPHPLFDTSYYTEIYPDVCQSQVNPLLHYLQFGAAELRDPHCLFQTKFYLESNPEVVEWQMNPLVHFLLHGAAANRDPSPFFDTGFYRKTYGIPPTQNPLIHYLVHGIKAGNIISARPDKIFSFSSPVKLSSSARRPKIVMTLAVRDEKDIIESQLRYHHWAGVDEFIVVDNGSTDGTLELLRSLSKDIPMHLSQDASVFHQGEWVSSMARFASRELDADWIINGDADEFFICRERSLQSILRDIPAKVGILEILRHDFVPVEPPPDSKNPPAWMRFRNRVSFNVAGCPLPPKVIHRPDESATVAYGSHSVIGPKLDGLSRLGSIEIFHYPIRTFAQFEAKARNSDREFGNQARSKASAEPGFHKVFWYDMLQDGQLAQEFARLIYSSERLRNAIDAHEVLLDDVLARRLTIMG